MPAEFFALNEKFGYQYVPIINVNDYISTIMIIGLVRVLGDTATQLQLSSQLQYLRNNFGNIESLKIFNDLMPNQPNLKRGYNVLNTQSTNNAHMPTDPCHCDLDSYWYYDHQSKEKIVYNKKRLSNDKSFIKLFDENEKLAHDLKGILSPGSYGLVVSPRKTREKNPIIYGANHDPVTTIPGTYYAYIIDSADAEVQMYIRTSNHLPFFFNTVNKNVSFLFERSLTSTSSLYIEPISYRALDRIEKIIIRQKNGKFASELLPVYKSISTGIVLDNNSTQILTFRNPSLFNYVEPLEIMTKIHFSKSIKDIITLLRITHPTSLLPLIIQGCDNNGNIFAGDISRPIVPPLNIDLRIPQGTFGKQPYYISMKDTIDAPIDVNSPNGYYASWNDPLIDCISIPYSGLNGPVPISRGYWISEWVSNYIKKNTNINLEIIRKLWQYVAKANALNGNSNNLFYNADFFVPVFKKPFLTQIKNIPSYQIFYEMLENFNGEWFNADNTSELITTHNISDAWILANVWLLRTAYVVMQPYANNLGLFTPFNPTANNKFPSINSVSYIGSINIFLLARILGVQKTGPTEFDWLNGRNINMIILDAFKYTLQILGDMPWGINNRPINNISVVFENSGGLDFYVDPITNIPGSNIPFLSSNTPAAITIADYNRNGACNIEAILSTGVSGLLLSNNPPTSPPNIPPSQILTSHTIDQLYPFWNYDIIKLQNK